MPATKPVAPRITARTGNDWACISRIEEDPAGRLTRHITTFRRHGRGYRRSEETHRLQLHSQATITTWLDALGFHTRTRRSYGEYRLTPRQRIFIARRCG